MTELGRGFGDTAPLPSELLIVRPIVGMPDQDVSTLYNSLFYCQLFINEYYDILIITFRQILHTIDIFCEYTKAMMEHT